MLFLIATPIGNLADFTFRALQTLEECDYLLCEDTRRSSILLKHYQVLKKPLRSFYKFNERAKEERILRDLEEGKKIGLLSDAGTPGIADPGVRLVMRCRERGIPVTPIPGACAAIVALSASGLETDRFQFVGFLPRTKGKLKKRVEELLTYPGTSICYVAPHRIREAIEAIASVAPERKCVLAREVTKKFETFLSAPAGELQLKLTQMPLKGEMVLLISPFLL
jgi:16S rRNA (cytidine1402-2'-O)-methyltransferase